MPDIAQHHEPPRDPRRVGLAPLLAGALDACRRRLMLGDLLINLLRWMAAAGLALLLVVVADHVAPRGLPAYLIFAAGLLWLAGSLFAALAIAAGCVRRLNDAYVAQALERTHGIRHNLVINTVLLEAAPQAAYALPAAARQAESAVASAAPSGNPLRVLRSPAVLCLAILAAWLIYAWLAPKPVGASLARMFGANRAAPSATWIELRRPQPGDVLHAGEPLELEFALRGRPVEQAWLEWRPAAEPTRAAVRTPLHRSGGRAEDIRRLTLAPHEVAGDLQFRCTAGDGELRGVLRVQPRPDIARWQIQITPPAYLGLPASTTADPELRLWQGARVHLAFDANAEIRDAVFVFRSDRETRTRMTVEPSDPRRASVTLPFDESGRWWVEFSDPWGYPFRDSQSHALDVRTDRPPRVTLVSPAEQDARDVVDVERVGRLAAAVADDVRITSALLVILRGERTERIDVLGPTAPTAGEAIEVGLAAAGLPLEIGETATAWFEATDNRARRDGKPAPQTGVSPTLTLTRSQPAPAEVAQAAESQPSAELAEDTPLVQRTRRRAAGEDGEGERGDSRSELAGGDEADVSDGEAGYVPVDGEAGVAESGRRSRTDDGGAASADSEASSDAEPRGTGEAAKDRKEFESELKRFVRKHGSELGQVNDKLAGEGGGGEGAGDAGGAESSPASQPAGETDQPPADTPRPSTEQPPLDQPSQREAKPGEETEPSPQNQSDDKARDNAEPSMPEQTDREPSRNESKPPSSPQSQPAAEPAEPKQGHEAPQSAGPSPPDADQPKQGPQPPQSAEPSPPKADQPKPSQDGQRQPPQDSRRDDSPADLPPAPGAGDQPAPGAEDRSDPAKGDPPAPSADEPAPASDQPAPGDQPPPPQEVPAAGPDSGQREPPESGQRERLPPTGLPRGAVVTPLPREQTPIDEITPSPQDDGAGDLGAAAVGRTEVASALELLSRGRDIGEEDLLALGWSPERRLAFLRDFERLQELARRAGVLSALSQWRWQAAPGEAGVSPARGLADELATTVGDGRPHADALAGITPPPEQRVPAELQAILDAYYRSLAQRRAGAAGRESGTP